MSSNYNILTVLATLTVLKRASYGHGMYFPFRHLKLYSEHFPLDDSSSCFLCDYENFMFFLPIKITTSQQTHEHILKSKVSLPEVIQIALLSSTLSKLGSKNILLYLMITPKKSVSHPNEGNYFISA